jgi:hypothetical protein
MSHCPVLPFLISTECLVAHTLLSGIHPLFRIMPNFLWNKITFRCIFRIEEKKALKKLYDTLPCCYIDIQLCVCDAFSLSKKHCQRQTSESSAKTLRYVWKSTPDRDRNKKHSWGNNNNKKNLHRPHSTCNACQRRDHDGNSMSCVRP